MHCAIPQLLFFLICLLLFFGGGGLAWHVLKYLKCVIVELLQVSVYSVINDFRQGQLNLEYEKLNMPSKSFC